MTKNDALCNTLKMPENRIKYGFFIGFWAFLMYNKYIKNKENRKIIHLLF